LKRHTKADAKYSRDLLQCWCIEGNCIHFDKKLCNMNYHDTIKDVRKKILKKIDEMFSDRVNRLNIKWISEQAQFYD